MKSVSIVVLCLAIAAYAFSDDLSDSIESRSSSKELQGGYTFVTTPAEGGKFKCECYKRGKRVWAGMCGVTDKSFSYSDCV